MFGSEVVGHRPSICARGTVEADLTDAADEGIGSSDRSIAKVISGHAVPAVGQVFGVYRKTPGLAIGRERQAGVQQAICRLIGHARSRVRDFGESAPVVTSAC